MLKHRLISIFYNRSKEMFLPEVSPSVLKRFSVYFSKVEAVSASVRDSKIRYQLHRQSFSRNNCISYNEFSFSVYCNAEIELKITPSIRHFFSLVSMGYFCWVSYDANQQTNNLSDHKNKGGKCSVCVRSTKA